MAPLLSCVGSSTRSAKGPHAAASDKHSRGKNSQWLVNEVHMTGAAKKHEAAKAVRRAAMLSDPNTRLADRAVAKLRGTFNKRRKGFIFEDAYQFLPPEVRGPDPKMERPVWTGCIDGVLSLANPTATNIG